MARRRGAALLSLLAVGLAPFWGAGAAPRAARDGEICDWLGEEMPLPLNVKTPQDLAVKTLAERHYLVYNLLAGGKRAYQDGEFSRAVEKWEALLKLPGLEPDIERAVRPLLNDARARASAVAAARKPPPPPPPPPPAPAAAAATPSRPPLARPSNAGVVSGNVSGGGAVGPGGTVVWLRRVSGATPRPAPALGRVIRQKDKTFFPHVTAVPAGSTVEFRNDDDIYHNVFSLSRPNNFDTGLYKAGGIYKRQFTNPGPIELLCNIHSTMQAYVYVVDTPYYAIARGSGAFTIRGVPPGEYELGAWHEASTEITRRRVTVRSDGTRVSVTVGGDKRPRTYVPDKYGKPRQSQLGY